MLIIFVQFSISKHGCFVFFGMDVNTYKHSLTRMDIHLHIFIITYTDIQTLLIILKLQIVKKRTKIKYIRIKFVFHP